MKLDPRLSERLDMLRFPLIVGVVFIHAYHSTVVVSGQEIGVSQTGHFASFTRYYLSNVIARVSVPLFFMLSGYLFFYGFDGTWAGYLRKFKSRTKSLVVPYLFWNVLVLLVFIVTQKSPAVYAYVKSTNPPISSLGIRGLFNLIFGINRQPIAYQFWFIRDLIVLVLLTPAIYYALKKTPYILLPLLLIAWLSDQWPIYIPAPLAAVFFSSGAYLSIHKINLSRIDPHGKVIIFIYLVLSVLDALTRQAEYHSLLHNIGVGFGVVSAFYFTSIIARTSRIKQWLLRLAPYSFFLFATHEPLLRLARLLAYSVIKPTRDAEIMLLYLTLPVLVIVICTTAYAVLNRSFPTMVATITWKMSIKNES